MIRSGDEFSQSQGGNNNAYCQDTQLSWLRWRLSEREEAFHEFVKRMIKIWRSQPVLQRRKFFQGRPIRGEWLRDILWLTPLGVEMTDHDWNKHYTRCLGMRLEGQMVDEFDERGKHITGDTLLILFNSHNEPIPFRLPPHAPNEYWQAELDTATDEPPPRMHAEESYPLSGHSLVILKLVRTKKSFLTMLV